MQSDKSVLVIDRFFAALEILKQEKVIRGKATFCRMVGVNRRNFWQVETNRRSDAFQTGWLSVIVSLGVDPRWLLTGIGKPVSLTKNEKI